MLDSRPQEISVLPIKSTSHEMGIKVDPSWSNRLKPHPLQLCVGIEIVIGIDNAYCLFRSRYRVVRC
jgi:hypothetical protein